MGTASIAKVDNFITSKDFESTKFQKAGVRDHSASMDAKLSAKLGYTPNETDEYSFTILTQNAFKNIQSNAIYGGLWRDYPTYDKTSMYVKTKTLIAPKTFVNFTAYYDRYYNVMKQFDDNKYLLQNTRKSFNSEYNDYSLGGILNLTTEALKNNVITLSINEKYDQHKERNQEIKANKKIGQKFVAGEPEQVYKDNTLFFGLEDVIKFNSYLKAVVGLSYNTRNNILAQEYGTHYLTGKKNQLYDFPTGKDNAFDYKAGVILEPAKAHTFTLSFAKRSRFASQKERYSSRFGSAVPNPDLKSEYTLAYDLTYSGRLGHKLQYEVSGFINDIQDAIFQKTVGKDSSGNPIGQNVNIGKALFQGVEVAFGYSPIEYLTIGANYSFIEMKDKTEDNNGHFTNVPTHKGMAYLNVNVPQIRSVINMNVETYGKRYLTSQGEQSPDFTLLNAKWSVALIKGLNFDLGVKNLLDKDYYLSYGYPKEGRTFITSLSYNF